MKLCIGQPSPPLLLTSSSSRGSKYSFLTVFFPLAYSGLVLRAKKNAELGLGKIGIHLRGVFSAMS